MFDRRIIAYAITNQIVATPRRLTASGRPEWLMVLDDNLSGQTQLPVRQLPPAGG